MNDGCVGVVDRAMSGSIEPGTSTWNNVAMDCPICSTDAWREGVVGDEEPPETTNGYDFYHCPVCEFVIGLRGGHY